MARSAPDRWRLAPKTRVVATREGVILASSVGCFRIKKQSTFSFVRDLLPSLYDPSAEAEDPDICAALASVGVLQRVASEQRGWSPSHTLAAAIAPTRATPLTDAVASRLSELAESPAPADRALLLIDHSELSVAESLQLARDVHASGRTSFSMWQQAEDVLLGPLTVPGQSPCWNCARLRFGDRVVSAESSALAPAGAGLVDAITDNVLLAMNYPQLAASGCLVVESSTGPSLHRIVPMPWCEVCGGAASGTPPGFAPTAPDSLVPPEVQPLADARTGIIRELLIFETAPGEDVVGPVSCSATIAPYQDGRRCLPASSGEGKGQNLEVAVWSAIGEGLERYSAALWSPSAITRAPFSVVADAAFDPRWLVLYDDDQYMAPGFRFARFDPEQPMDWVEGHWLDTQEPVLLPAIATFMHFPAPASEQLCQVTSSGLAADLTRDGATLRAVYELIERDAFMLYWLARRTARRIAVESCDPAISTLLREIEDLGARAELYVLDVGTGVPTVVCLGLGDGRSWPGATIGLCAHADPEVAIQRAVLEHGHCGAYIRRLMLEGRHASVQTPERVVNALDHALYYVSTKHVSAFSDFRADLGQPLTLAELRRRYQQEARLDACVSRLRNASIRTAIVDVTSPDVGLTPVRVARAFGCYLQPIHFGFSNRRLANPRLRQWLPDRRQAQTEPHPIA